MLLQQITIDTLIALLRESRERLDEYRQDFPATEPEFVDGRDPLTDLIERIDAALAAPTPDHT